MEEERKETIAKDINIKESKISLIFSGFKNENNIEFYTKDFIIKTLRISIENLRNQKPIFLQMFIDTTQISLLEEEKAQSHYQRQMLANASHEFRTPLNAMSMSLYLMKDSISDSLLKYHKIASSSCDILKGFVEDILDHSKIESGVFEIENTTFLFKDLFEEVQEIFELQAMHKGINLEFDIEDPLTHIYIETDKQRIKQILLNLISNALKFTDEGSIKVHLQFLKVKKRFVKQNK